MYSKAEEKYWKSLTIEHMSEESDDGNDIIVHHLPWRSQGNCPCVLSLLFSDLNGLHEAKLKKHGMSKWLPIIT